MLSEHRSVGGQTYDREEGLLEPVPDHVLVGVRQVRILSGEDRQVGQDAVGADRKRLERTRVSTRGRCWTRPPVVQIRGVCQPGPQGLQQDPGGAKRPGFGLLGGEEEPDVAVAREADVAVGPVGHVLHQPLQVRHGQVVDVERSSWTASANNDTKAFIDTRCTRQRNRIA